MKVVLFCGGLGTRLRDYSDEIPKPMVPVGGRPIAWHIMKYYAHFGHDDFVLCLGYKRESFVDYFVNYQYRNRDVTVQLGGTSDLRPGVYLVRLSRDGQASTQRATVLR